MVRSKKLLSLFLAVVMVLSVFTVMASAYTRVETEGTVDIDIKYTVEEVDTLPETEAGSAEYSGDNLYAVTVWMKSAKAVDILTAPFHYNKAHFAPITLTDGEYTYPYGAGLDQDTYYSDMGEGANYLYTLGDFMNNTGMYKADGSKATTKALAKCIGLGNSNSEGVKVLTEFVSPDHPTYNKWGAGLPENTGVMFVQLNVAGKAKTAYLNTIDGIYTNPDWNRMVTVYFEKITDEDVAGDEFGVFTDNCYTVDGNYDNKSTGYFLGATQYQALVPSMNVVSNAVVGGEEEPATPLTVSYWKDQIKFNTVGGSGANANKYNGTFDYRILATIDNFDDVYASIEENTIIDVGFIFNKGAAIDLDAAKAQVEDGTETYSQVKDVYVSTAYQGEKYVMSCIVRKVADADKGSLLSAMAYIVYEQDGETKYAYFDEVQTSTFETLYSTYYPQAAEQNGWEV